MNTLELCAAAMDLALAAIAGDAGYHGRNARLNALAEEATR